jgi:steroid delta-isomerase-like uncharacterized protein
MEGEYPMSAEENKAIIRRAFDVWNKGNLDIFDELFATNYVYHDPGNPEVCSQKDYRRFVSRVRTAFPDMHLATEDIIAEGDKIAVRYTFRGTHTGGGSPTGKNVTITGIGIMRFADGKVVEFWVNADMLGYRQQLGAVPSAE